MFQDWIGTKRSNGACRPRSCWMGSRKKEQYKAVFLMDWAGIGLGLGWLALSMQPGRGVLNLMLFSNKRSYNLFTGWVCSCKLGTMTLSRKGLVTGVSFADTWRTGHTGLSWSIVTHNRLEFEQGNRHVAKNDKVLAMEELEFQRTSMLAPCKAIGVFWHSLEDLKHWGFTGSWICRGMTP